MGVERKQEETSRTWTLSVQCREDSERWFPEIAHSIVHHALGLGGETGEFLDWIKKLDRGSADLKDANTRFEVMMELTDVYIYVLNLAALLGVDLEKSYAHKRARNEQRFGNGVKK